MKTIYSISTKLILLALTTLLLATCTQDNVLKKKTERPTETPNIPAKIIQKLSDAGFVTSEGLSLYGEGYLVEGDIYLTQEQILNLKPKNPINARIEQYRSDNIVSAVLGGNRTIKVYMSTNFSSYMQTACNTALDRYNNINLRLTFVKESDPSNADIKILDFYQIFPAILGKSGGFPENGNPANRIELNTRYFNNRSRRNDASTTIAHEIGHAIGFRHTDYMNRSFSCGGGGNEGAGSVGVNLIPGSPTGPEKGSWMLACSDGFDRPFTKNDILALRRLYHKRQHYSSFQLNNRRIASLDGTTLYVKENSLYAERVLMMYNVSDYQIQGNRIGVLTSDGVLRVKDGGLSAPWVWIYQNVKSFQLELEGNRIGVLTSDGVLRVKQGWLSAPWVWIYQNVKSFQLEGNRIGVLTSDGDLRVKEGGLSTAWAYQF